MNYVLVFATLVFGAAGSKLYHELPLTVQNCMNDFGYDNSSPSATAACDFLGLHTRSPATSSQRLQTLACTWSAIPRDAIALGHAICEHCDRPILGVCTTYAFDQNGEPYVVG